MPEERVRVCEVHQQSLRHISVRTESGARDEAGPAPSFLAILRHREAWGASLGHFFINYGFYFVISWLPTYLVKAGWKSTTIKAGDKVKVTARPFKNGDPGGLFVTGGFAYVQPAYPHSEAAGEPIELAPEPSWGRVAYRR